MYLNLLTILSENEKMAKALIDAGVVIGLIEMLDENDADVLIYLSRVFALLCPLLSRSELALLPLEKLIQLTQLKETKIVGATF